MILVNDLLPNASKQDNAHAQGGLDDECYERNDVNTLVVLCDVHDDLQEQGREGDARPVAKVGEDGNDGNNGKDDCSSYEDYGYMIARIGEALTVILGDPVVHTNATK